jgi:hypothetical protein
MEPLKEFARHIFDNLGKYGTIASFILTVAGGVLASETLMRVSKLFSFLREKKAVVVDPRQNDRYAGYSEAPISPSQVARERATRRLDEAKQLMTSNRGSARISRISSNLLTVGQYIIGGVLATSVCAGIPLV